MNRLCLEKGRIEFEVHAIRCGCGHPFAFVKDYWRDVFGRRQFLWRCVGCEKEVWTDQRFLRQPVLTPYATREVPAL